jgi:hypothetical protein
MNAEGGERVFAATRRRVHGMAWGGLEIAPVKCLLSHVLRSPVARPKYQRNGAGGYGAPWAVQRP